MPTQHPPPMPPPAQPQLAETSIEGGAEIQEKETETKCCRSIEAGSLCISPASESAQIAGNGNTGMRETGADPQSISVGLKRDAAQFRECGSITSENNGRDGTSSPVPKPQRALGSMTRELSGSTIQHSTTSPYTPNGRLPWKRRYFAFLNNWWYWEIISMLFSGLLLFATITLLVCIEGMSLSAWSFNYIQPSTMISLFMTISKSASLMVITECIGQAKWWDFAHRSHPLTWFQEYDEATRGPLGSLLILQRVGRISWLAIAGAVITLLALGVEAFAQQVVQYQERMASKGGDTATLSVTQDLDYFNAITMQGSILDGVYLDSQPSDAYRCTTGYCDWPVPVVTLGVCSRCTDITSRQTPTCTSTPGPLESSAADIDEWSFESTRCNYTINANISVSVNIQSVSFPERDGRPEEHASQWTRFKITTPDIKEGLGDEIGGGERWISTMLSYATLYSQDTTPLPRMTIEVLQPSLFACGLYWCAQVYDSPAVVNGTAPTQEPSAEFRLVAPVGPNGEVSVQTTVGVSNVLQVPGSALAGYPAGASRNFTVDQNTHIRLSDYLEDLFNVTRNGGNDAFSVFPDPDSELTGFTDAVYGSSPPSADPSATFARIARTMTNQVRQSRSSYVLAGRALDNETYVVVDWRWMALPLCVFALGVGLLAATVVGDLRSVAAPRPRRIWKSSALAVLMYRLQPGWEPGTAPPQTLEELDRFADGIKVQLSDEIGGR